MAGQATDTVVVTLGDGVAEVQQRLTPRGATVEAFAMRLEEQTLEMLEVVREGESLLDAVLSPVGGAYRLDVVSGAPIRVRYAVRGSVERIPLFVTGGRAELRVVRELETPYLIRLEGDPARLSALDLATSLPRFAPSETGELEAVLSSLPALLRLSQGGALSFTRVADLIVLVVMVLGVAWAWRNGRVLRRASGGRA